MPEDIPDFSEDEHILDALDDPLDVEAFTNLMGHAHQQGKTAADFVREDPARTSRHAIRKLCLSDRPRSLWTQIKATARRTPTTRRKAGRAYHARSASEAASFMKSIQSGRHGFPERFAYPPALLASASRPRSCPRRRGRS